MMNDCRWHGYLVDGSIVVVTSSHLLLLHNSFQACELSWECALVDLVALTVDFDRNEILSSRTEAMTRALVDDAALPLFEEPHARSHSRAHADDVGNITGLSFPSLSPTLAPTSSRVHRERERDQHRRAESAKGDIRASIDSKKKDLLKLKGSPTLTLHFDAATTSR